MRKRNQFTFGLVIAGVMLNHATSALAFSGPAGGGFEYLDNFPAMCSEATAQQPLDGHVLRMGFVAQTNFGWSFLFPDKRSREGMLERVQLLDNAGMVGQHPDEDLGEQIRLRTGANFFVVAHIFVGDPNSEPVATCISAPMPFAQFGATYGSYYDWLSPDRFGTYLGYRRYDRWHWNKYWSFKNIRTKFRSYWGKEGWRKSYKFKHYRKYRRDHDGRFRRIDDDRPGRSDDFKKRIDRTKKPITTKPDSGDDGRRKGGWRTRDRDDDFKMPEKIAPKDPMLKKPDSGDDNRRKRGWRPRVTKGDDFKKPEGLTIKDPATSGPNPSGGPKKKWTSVKPKSAKMDPQGGHDDDGQRTGSKKSPRKPKN